MPGEGGRGIMHAELTIGDAAIMCAEATAEWQPSTSGLFIYHANVPAAYASALALGCTTILEPADRGYGMTCGVTDPWGNIWWITEPEQQ